MFACSRRTGSGGLENSCIHIQSAGGIRKGFENHCLPGPVPIRPAPKSAQPMPLFFEKGGGVRLNPSLCIGCGNCVEACPFGAIAWDKTNNKPLICIYCGYCASYCPYDVIALEEIEEVNNVR